MAVAAAGAPERSGASPPCTLQAGPTRAVVRVIDAETVLLDDNQEVRLIGALAPRSPDLSPGAEPWPPEEAAIAALRALVQGRSVSLATSGRRAIATAAARASLRRARRRARVGAGRTADRRPCARLRPARQLRLHARAAGARARGARRGCAACGRTPPTRCAPRAAHARAPAPAQFLRDRRRHGRARWR